MYNPTKPYKTKILSLIAQTWQTPYVNIQKGAYPIIRKKFIGLEVDHTDGIGTKGLYHWQKRTFRNAVLDALAMNLNDLAMAGAVAYKLQNHIILPKDDHDAIEKIIKALVAECKKRNIAITGGETSIHGNMIGMDISMTVSGSIKNIKLNQCQAGDIIIGLKSSGLHSNGFTKVCEIFKKEFRPEFTAPTAIYYDALKNIRDKYTVHALMHITGGAFTKLKDILRNVDAVITNDHSPRPQNIFMELYRRGISDKEMYKFFNCGIGFIISVPSREALQIAAELHGDIIGKCQPGTGKVIIESAFSNKRLVY